MTRCNVLAAAISLALVICYPSQAAPSSSPPQIVKKVQPEYTQEALDASISGTVILSAEIDENGVPSHLRLVRGLGWGLDQKAFQAVRQWRFRPALRKGAPVRMRVPIEVSFRLKLPSA
jgi:periplasmic protein TonB